MAASRSVVLSAGMSPSGASSGAAAGAGAGWRARACCSASSAALAPASAGVRGTGRGVCSAPAIRPLPSPAMPSSAAAPPTPAITSDSAPPSMVPTFCDSWFAAPCVASPTNSLAPPKPALTVREPVCPAVMRPSNVSSATFRPRRCPMPCSKAAEAVPETVLAERAICPSVSRAFVSSPSYRSSNRW